MKAVELNEFNGLRLFRRLNGGHFIVWTPDLVLLKRAVRGGNRNPRL